MRINKFIAERSELSRRAADEAILQNRVLVNGLLPTSGQQITDKDAVTLDGANLSQKPVMTTIILNKPVGYVCSRDGQGSKTIYELLPDEYQHLQTVGRLDKNSSGLLLLTNDGHLAQELTHPKYQKAKVYTVSLNKPLHVTDQKFIQTHGVTLDDGVSAFKIEQTADAKSYIVTLREGRNRQIRRTFEAINYDVKSLHRTEFGQYSLDSLLPGKLLLL